MWTGSTPRTAAFSPRSWPPPCARKVSLSQPTPRTAWRAPDTVAATQADFRRARDLGVRSFPALLLETPDGIREVTPGYAHTAALDARLRTLLDRHAVSN